MLKRKASSFLHGTAALDSCFNFSTGVHMHPGAQPVVPVSASVSQGCGERFLLTAKLSQSPATGSKEVGASLLLEHAARMETNMETV